MMTMLSICKKCSFPALLVTSILQETERKSTFPLKIIARAGLANSNLISAINSGNSFSIYENEFPELVNITIKSVDGLHLSKEASYRLRKTRFKIEHFVCF